MRRRLSLALTIVLAAACGPSAAPASSATPVPSATPTPTLAQATSTPTVAPTPVATAAPSPTRSPIPMPSFAEISAPASRAVWILVGGQRLFMSIDSGDTWQERSLPAAGTPSISFVTAREGWVAFPGPGLDCSQQPPELWHTTDAGATFEKVPPAALPPGQCKDGPSFIDSQRGFMGSWAPSGSPTIYRTSDGGKTWSAPPGAFPDPPGFTARAPGSTLRPGRVRAFGSTLLVYAAGQTTTSGALYVYRSTDAGATWAYLAKAPALSELAFITTTRWIQLASPSDSVETIDGGATWHPLATDYRQAAPIAPSVIFADESVGYATVRGSVQRTLDGGAHWSGIRTPGT